MTTEETNPCNEIENPRGDTPQGTSSNSWTERNSNPARPVVQGAFNLGNWMTAYQSAQQNVTAPKVQVQTPVKVETVEEKFEGGWKAEGKEKPETLKICPRCQWTHKARLSEPDQELWCEQCLRGEILGDDPDKSYRPPEPKGSAANLNKTFFG